MKLAAYLNDHRCGEFDDSGGYRFTYDPDWQHSPTSHPVSFSLPTITQEHRGKAVEAFLRGLLPDNEQTLRAWGRRFGCSPRRPLELLAHVGADCIGALRFVPPEQDPEAWLKQSTIDWLTDEELCERIRDLLTSRTDGRQETDLGQFSLPGAQAKTALRFDRTNKRWGIPSGAEPTDHIFKPVLLDYDNQVWCEHFCLQLARAVGLEAVKSQVLNICGNDIVVLERYDRAIDDSGTMQRIHQEDVCQALAVLPEHKYEAATAARQARGPGVQEMIQLAGESADPPATEMHWFRAVIFNLLIGGTDAHAKNYGLIWSARSQWHPAPLYDLNSILPWMRPYGTQVDQQKVKLAMRMGGHYHLDHIQMHHIEAQAKSCGIPANVAISETTSLATRVGKTLTQISDQLQAEGCSTAFLQRLVDSIAANSRRWESQA